MSKDQLLGALILLVAIAVIGIYLWLEIFVSAVWALEIVGTIAVIAVMGIIAWIGWTMATTPAPEPIEALEEKPATSDTEKPEEKKE